MFCPNCGSQLPDNSKYCSSCGKNVTGLNSGFSFQNKMKSISRNTLSPLKLFFANPVGGIALTFEKLGKKEALNVGIIFCVIYAVISLIGAYSILPRYLQPGFTDSLKAFLLILALPIGEFFLLSLICFTFNLKSKSAVNLFIAGASVLPLGLYLLFYGLLIVPNLGNRTDIIIAMQIFIAVALFAFTYSVLIIYAGLTKILKIPETTATVSVPIILLSGIYLAEIVFVIFIS